MLLFQYISAFAASAISSNFERLGKPFNPLLGETFEFNRYAYKNHRLLGHGHPTFFLLNEKKIEVSLHFYDFNMHDLLINVYHVPL